MKFKIDDTQVEVRRGVSGGKIYIVAGKEAKSFDSRVPFSEAMIWIKESLKKQKENE